MIIVSQDRTKIINFEKVEILGQDQNDRKRIGCGFNNGKMYLGEYKTEERAKEVLVEIVKKYSSYMQLTGGPAIVQGQIDIQPNIFNIPKVYEMPKE